MISREKNNSILMDNSIGKFLKRNSMILFALIIMFALLAITSDSFLTSQNIKSVLCQISINGVLAFGMATALIIGGIDLSVGSVMALCGCICVQLINMGIPAILSIFLTLLVGLRRWTKGYTIKQPNMDCQPTEKTALMRHRAVFS